MRLILHEHFLVARLTYVKPKITVQNSTFYNNEAAKEKELSGVIKELNKFEVPIWDCDTQKKQLANFDLAYSLSMEEVARRQRSRFLWTWEGDCNRKFFYQMAISYYISNLIIDVMDYNGQNGQNKIV